MKKSIKFFAGLLAALMIFAMIPMTAMADAAKMRITEFDRGYWGPQDTPLLVLLVNFDPSLNGADGEDGEVMLRHNDHRYWHDMLFGNGPKGLRAFYEEQSDGHFHFIPAEENYENPSQGDRKNDGIVEVSVPLSMDNRSGSTSDPERYEALKAAVQNGYVDFSVYDKDKNGVVDKTEVMVAFIVAGGEYTRNGPTPSYNAHESSFNYGFGDVKVTTEYVKVGEMMNNGPLTVGTFCHELGHALGNGDLYAAGARGSWGGENSPAGKMSVMAGGGSSGKNSGERAGESPANFDPYHSIIYGLYDYTDVGDGEYTLYSRQSKQGEYNILKVSSPDPMEYYLIENRYFDNSSIHFDSEVNYTGSRGIIIWHIDQGVADAGRAGPGMRINSKGTNADIGVAALRPAKAGDNQNPATSGVFNKEGLVFDCRGYQFPGSGTWNTRLSDEQAKDFNLKIEILDDPGHEMRIKVMGAPTNVSPRFSYSVDSTKTEFTCAGQITDLNNQVLTGMRFEISDKEDFSNILASSPVTPEKDGTYEGYVNGLVEDTYYYTRIVLETETGEYTDVVRDKTARPVVVDTTSYNVNFYRGLRENDRPYSQKAMVGEPIITKFPMNKPGFVFAGWYRDAAFTEYFEIGNGKDDYKDIDLYARWVKPEEAAKLTVSGAKLLNDKCNPAGYGVVGESFHEPIPEIPAGKTFIGWYEDAAFSAPFDFINVIESSDPVTVYARFDGDEPAETTAGTTAPVTPETTVETTVAPETEDTTPAETTETTEESAEKASSNVALIVILSVVGVAVVVTVVIVLVKKKK